MFIKFLLCFSIFFPYWIFTAEAKPTLHVLIMCDTVSSNIKKASFVDLKNMKQASKVIAHQLKMKKKMTVLKDKKMNAKSLQKWVKTLSFNPNDVVIFYYSGHGFRQKRDSTPWPSFLLNKTEKQLRLVSGEKICKILKKHSPRFALILFDCCNFEISSKKLFDVTKSSLLYSSQSFPGLRSLFYSTRGIVTISASAPGEFAIAITGGRDKGSLFTTTFINSLLQKSRKSSVTWHEVLKQTELKCSQLSDMTQNPIGMIETKSIQ